MKKIITAMMLCCCIGMTFGITSCGGEKEPEKAPDVDISLDYLGFTPNVYTGVKVNLPDPFIQDDEENSKKIITSIKDPDGEVIEVKNGEFTPEKLGVYDILYELGESKLTEHFYVLENSVINGAEYEGQEKFWTAADGDGNCELVRNTDSAYVIEGNASYKILVDGKKSGGFPGIYLDARNMPGMVEEDNIPAVKFSNYDEFRFAFYNNTDKVQQVGMKFYSNDGIMQTVDSLVNAYGVQPGEWVHISVSMDAFHAYSSTFSTDYITGMKFFVKNVTNDFKEFYFDDFRLVNYNDPKEDYAGLKDNETITFDAFDIETQSYSKKSMNVKETLVTGFENKSDAIKIEPYRKGISRYCDYTVLEEANRKTDSGNGLMYYKSGGDVWNMTFETMLKGNRKLSMLLFTDYDFSKHDYLAVDIFNPSDVTGIFVLGVASETAGYIAYQEQTTIEGKSWGTIYLNIANATLYKTEDNSNGIDTKNIMEVNIGTNPNIVTTGFYIDNLRFVDAV